MKIKINIPEFVARVINAMECNGFEAFVVGGCVRDSLMGKKPHDWDVCTNALPQQIISVLDGEFRVIPTGIKHGTVTVISDNNPIEVTTYRTESGYTDYRHPSSVSFVGDISGDLMRRDFTVNAMAYSEKKGIIDLFGGADDIKNGVLRCVGNADMRFCEDALRIMRALRLSAVCELETARDTDLAIRKNKGLLCHIAVERIYTELKKLLTAEKPSNILIEYRDVFEEIIPEVFSIDVFDINRIKAIDNLQIGDLRLAALVCAADNPREILARLKTDKETRRRAEAIKGLEEEEVPDSKIAVKRLLKTRGEAAVCDWLTINAAINRDKKYVYALEGAKQIIENRECYSLKNLAVNGSDLTERGIAFGGEVGKILDELLSAVIDDRVKNEKNSLLAYLMSKEN